MLAFEYPQWSQRFFLIFLFFAKRRPRVAKRRQITHSDICFSLIRFETSPCAKLFTSRSVSKLCGNGSGSGNYFKMKGLAFSYRGKVKFETSRVSIAFLLNEHSTIKQKRYRLLANELAFESLLEKHFGHFISDV